MSKTRHHLTLTFLVLIGSMALIPIAHAEQDMLDKADALLHEFDESALADDIDELRSLRRHIAKDLEEIKEGVDKKKREIITARESIAGKRDLTIILIGADRTKARNQQSMLSEKLGKMKSSHPDYESLRYEYMQVSQKLAELSQDTKRAIANHDKQAKKLDAIYAQVEAIENKRIPELKKLLAEVDRKIYTLTGKLQKHAEAGEDTGNLSFSYRGEWETKCVIDFMGTKGTAIYKGNIFIHVNGEKVTGEQSMTLMMSNIDNQITQKRMPPGTGVAKINGQYIPRSNTLTADLKWNVAEAAAIGGSKLIGKVYTPARKVDPKGSFGRGTIIYGSKVAQDCRGSWELDVMLKSPRKK